MCVPEPASIQAAAVRAFFSRQCSSMLLSRSAKSRWQHCVLGMLLRSMYTKLVYLRHIMKAFLLLEAKRDRGDHDYHLYI